MAVNSAILHSRKPRLLRFPIHKRGCDTNIKRDLLEKLKIHNKPPKSQKGKYVYEYTKKKKGLYSKTDIRK